MQGGRRFWRIRSTPPKVKNLVYHTPEVKNMVYPLSPGVANLVYPPREFGLPPRQGYPPHRGYLLTMVYMSVIESMCTQKPIHRCLRMHA